MIMRTIKEEKELLTIIAKRLWSTTEKVETAIAIMDEHQNEPIEYRGLVYETILAILETWNDEELLTDFHLNIPDPELG